MRSSGSRTSRACRRRCWTISCGSSGATIPIFWGPREVTFASRRAIPPRPGIEALPERAGGVARVEEEPHAERRERDHHARVQEQLQRAPEPALGLLVIVLVAGVQDASDPEIEPVQPEQRGGEQRHRQRYEHEAHHEVAAPGVRHVREEPQQPKWDPDPQDQTARGEHDQQKGGGEPVEDASARLALHGLGSRTHRDHRQAQANAKASRTAISTMTTIALIRLTPYMTCQKTAMPTMDTSRRDRRPRPPAFAMAACCLSSSVTSPSDRRSR